MNNNFETDLRLRGQRGTSYPVVSNIASQSPPRALGIPGGSNGFSSLLNDQRTQLPLVGSFAMMGALPDLPGGVNLRFPVTGTMDGLPPLVFNNPAGGPPAPPHESNPGKPPLPGGIPQPWRPTGWLWLLQDPRKVVYPVDQIQALKEVLEIWPNKWGPRASSESRGHSPWEEDGDHTLWCSCNVSKTGLPNQIAYIIKAQIAGKPTKPVSVTHLYICLKVVGINPMTPFIREFKELPAENGRWITCCSPDAEVRGSLNGPSDPGPQVDIPEGATVSIKACAEDSDGHKAEALVQFEW